MSDTLVSLNNIAEMQQDLLLSMYKTMVKIRRFEEYVAELIIRNEIKCPCHLYIGQEAIAAGVCAGLRDDDYVFSTHRSHGHFIAKGGDIKLLMSELYCKKSGCSKGRGGSMHLASHKIGLPGSSAIVAGTIPLAVGAALAFSIKGIDSISVAFFGDGATNEGTFYESLNFASLKKLPVVFVCENNLYSTHMPVTACLANTNISAKADAFGMPGIKIDGNDILAVFGAAKMAINRARNGDGPTLIECMTYRWRGHVGPNFDLDKGLRENKELEYWIDRCPIKRFKSLLTKYGILSEQENSRIYDHTDRTIDEAVLFAQESPYPSDDIENFMDVFRV